MKNDKILSLIGLATKAGKTVSGEFSTEKSVKTGKGYLVLVAADASENTQKKFRNMCGFYEVPDLFPFRQRTPWQSDGKRIPRQSFCAGPKLCRGAQKRTGEERI